MFFFSNKEQNLSLGYNISGQMTTSEKKKKYSEILFFFIHATIPKTHLFKGKTLPSILWVKDPDLFR